MLDVNERTNKNDHGTNAFPHAVEGQAYRMRDEKRKEDIV
jgi:hypothetical protein